MLLLIVSWVVSAVSPINAGLVLTVQTLLGHPGFAAHATVALVVLLVVLAPVAAYLERRRASQR